VIDVTERGLFLRDLASGWNLEEVQELTGAELHF